MVGGPACLVFEAGCIGSTVKSLSIWMSGPNLFSISLNQQLKLSPFSQFLVVRPDPLLIWYGDSTAETEWFFLSFSCWFKLSEEKRAGKTTKNWEKLLSFSCWFTLSEEERVGPETKNWAAAASASAVERGIGGRRENLTWGWLEVKLAPYTKREPCYLTETQTRNLGFSY